MLLSARRVGPSGFAYGVDMTDEMLTLARENAAKAGADNVEFLGGEIEALPLPDAAVDVVISNCVINLSTDKPAVLAEMFRVLVPGGRIGITDVVAEDHLTPPIAPPPARTSGASPAPVPQRVPRRAHRSWVHRRIGHLQRQGSPRHALSHRPGRQAQLHLTGAVAGGGWPGSPAQAYAAASSYVSLPPQIQQLGHTTLKRVTGPNGTHLLS